MIPAGLVRKALRDGRGIAIGAAITIFVNVVLHASIYPGPGEASSIEYPDVLKGIFGEAGSINSPEGYAGSYLANCALLLSILAIVVGTAATAGEEGAGTLDLLLAQPIARASLLLGKAAGLAGGLAAAALIAIPAFLVATLSADQHLSTWRLAAATLSLLPFPLLFLALGLWAGAALRSRAAAAMAATAVIVVAYFLNALGAAVDFLEIPRRFSPFYWVDPSHVLLHGFDWLRLGGFLAASALLLALATWSFSRRDLTIGARERRLARLAPAAAATTRRRRESIVARHFPLAHKSVRDVRGAALIGGLSAALLAFIDSAVYPPYRDALESYEYPAAVRGMLGEAGSLASPEGFMTAQFFNLMPLLFVTLVIIAGTAATAGEESAGTLDLLLAQPLRRARLLLVRWSTIFACLALATFVSVPGFALGSALVDMDLATSRFAAAVLNVAGLEFLFLGFALFAGSTLPNRSSAVMLVAGTMVACYLLPTLAATSGLFDAAQRASPFYWASASHALLHGVDPLRLAAPFGVGILFLGLGAWRFDRRDIAVSTREWSLAAMLRRNRRPPAAPATTREAMA